MFGDGGVDKERKRKKAFALCGIDGVIVRLRCFI